MTPEVALTNLVPALFTDADCRTLVAAAAAHLPAFCALWGIEAPVVTYYPDRSKVPATSIEIALLDQPPAEDQGVEAFHEDPNGLPDGQCFAGYLLSQGGAKFSGQLAVSVAWSHELLEYLRNPRANLLIQENVVAPDGKTYPAIWAEVGDPAQGEHFAYTIGGVEVWMAGYVTPAWEDPHGAAPYSMPEHIIPTPLTIGDQGYGGFVDAQGNVATVFHANAHPALIALKSKHGRLADAQRAAAAKRAA